MSAIFTEQRQTLSADETQALGRSLGERAQPGDFIACNGPLGAGKTTFIQGFAAGLGIGEEQYVRSPTFTLVQEYEGRVPLFHFDFYRLSQPDEVWDIGFEDYLNSGGILIVEWAEKFPSVLPESRLDIGIRITAAEQRCIEWTASSSSYRHYLLQLTV